MDDFRVGSKWDDILEESKRIHEQLKKKVDLNNEIQIMKAVFKDSDVLGITQEYLQNLKPFMKKSNDISKKIRDEGNQIYKSNTSMFKCIVIYTGALMSSESGSLEMAFAHSNRAAALMKMQFFEEALLDTEMAIKFNHTDLFKMYERKCECSFQIHSKDKLEQNLLELETFSNSKPNKQRLDAVRKYRKYLNLMIEYENKNPQEKPAEPSSQSNPPKNTVKLMRNEKQGRYVLANRVIKKDEPIFVEKPFAFVPVHDGSKRITNIDCENCALSNIIPFPCLNCGRASYCSPECLEKHEKIHKYECEGYKKNLWYQIGIAHLSIRTMLTGIDVLVRKIREFDPKIHRNNPEKIFQHLEEVCSRDYNNYFQENSSRDEFRDYGQVFGLCTNFFTKNRAIFQKNLYYAITALLMTIYLKNYTTFFQDFVDTNIMSESDWELFISSILLRHIGQLIINGHAIVDFRQSIFQMNSLDLVLFKDFVVCGGLHALLKSERIFTGIFPRISMLNHSCDSNIRNVFENNQLTIFATRDLKENDEVYNCYGPNYKLMSFKERQNSLKLQYDFECVCEKCREKNDKHRLNNSVVCKSCGSRILYPDADPVATDDATSKPLKCQNCNTIYENKPVKLFYQHLLQEDKSKINVLLVYECYKKAIEDLGELDVIRLNMMSLLLETLIKCYDSIKFYNASLIYDLSLDLLNAKEKLYGNKSIEFVESSFYYLDVLGIVLSKQIPFTMNQPVLDKILEALKILSSNTRRIVESYIQQNIYEVAPY